MKYALVSGGSKGIGFGIATALARRKFNLILIARNAEDLNTARTKLESMYPVVVETFPIDLNDQDAAIKVGNWCLEKKLPVSVLCNVTGMGGAADFLSNSLDESLYMLRLNMEPAVALVYQLLPVLNDNQPSYILNVSSMAGFAPISVKNIYSASKSAMIFFSYSLHYQLKAMGISVSCLCPGPVFTNPDIQKETIAKLGRFGNWMALSPEKIGEIAVTDTLNGKMLIVPGTLNKIISVLIRFLPRKLVSWLYYKTADHQSHAGVLLPSGK